MKKARQRRVIGCIVLATQGAKTEIFVHSEATFLRHFVLVFSFRPFITRPQFSLALEPTRATNEMGAV